MAELASTLERQRRVFALMAEVVALEPEQREAVYAAADREIADQARALLEADPSGEDWLHPDRLTGVGLEPKTVLKNRTVLPAGRMIGRYRILETIGVGGMGTVYLAEQEEPVARKVALKVLRLSLDREEDRRRFSSERHAMGRLDHPNVATILDAGTTDDGIPFLAMERIDGEPITDYCDRQRLSIEERLGLFVQVCRGVDHAHRQFLLHRDIKPSNVLVAEIDGEPVPKLIDFGIVKGLDGSLLGAPAVDAEPPAGRRVLGTPLYMSPEALGLGGATGGDPGPGPGPDPAVDIRSDVFSLGVLLYELLAGVRPWAGAGADMALMIRQRTAGEAPKPTRRLGDLEHDELREIGSRRKAASARWFSRLRGDLDAIVSKAINRRADERYESARGLALDIERHLGHEPVLARPPRRLYVLRKRLVRHRGLVALFTALILGLAGTLVGFFEARQQTRDAVAARDESERLVDFMVDVFRDSRPGEDADGVSARELMSRGSQLLETELARDPRHQARFQEVLGRIYSQWRLLDEAEPLLESAVQSARLEDPGGRSVIQPLTSLAWLRYYQQRFDEARDLAQQALELAQPFADEEPIQLASLHSYLGTIEARRGELEAAEMHQEQALAWHSRDPEGSAAILAQIYRGQARVQMRRRSYEQATAPALEALRVTEQHYGEQHPRTASALSLLGIIYYRLKEFEEAEQTALRALRVIEKNYGEEAPQVSDLLITLGNIQKDGGRLEEAETSYRRAVKILREHQPWSRDLASVLQNFGHMLVFMLDRASEGRPMLLEALALKEKRVGAEDPWLVTTLTALGALELEQGAAVEAEAFFRRVLDIQASVEYPDPGKTGEAWLYLGRSLRAQQRLGEALPALENALSIFRDLDFPKSIALVEAELEALQAETARR